LEALQKWTTIANGGITDLDISNTIMLATISEAFSPFRPLPSGVKLLYFTKL